MNTIAKTYAGHSIKEEYLFRDSEFEWGAWNQALRWLYERGYQTGSMDHPNPVGFTQGRYSFPWKWHNLTNDDKSKLDGVLTSEDFRTKPVKVLIFEDQNHFVSEGCSKE